jgi:signal transduction histidine kinase
METVLQRVLSLLTVPPGNLIVHLVLAFSVLASLQTALIGRRSSQAPHTRRLVLGLSMLLAGQLGLFFSSGLAWQGLLNPHLFMPPLDRAIMVFSLVWIIWMWNFPQPARLGDLVTGFLNLGIVLLFIFTYSSWSASGAETAFNNSWIDWTWELAALFIVLTGMAVILFSRPAGWEFGLGMLGISLAGLVAHLTLTPQAGDFSGFIRLSQLAAYPLLPTLLNRLFLPAVQPQAKQSDEQTSAYTNTSLASATPAAMTSGITGLAAQARQERRRYSSDPRTVNAWLALKTETDPEKLAGAVARALSHTMLADMAFIATGPVFGQIILHSGYDLVREDSIEGVALDPAQTPLLATALQRGRSMRITSNDTQTNDLHAISAVLGLKDGGSLMLIPLMAKEKPWGGILMLSPYSNRQWTQEDQTYLASETGQIAEILFRAQSEMENSLGTQLADEQLIQMQAELDWLRKENQRLARESEDTQQNEALPQPPPPDLSAMVALQQEAQETISGLQIENERLHAALQEASQADQNAAPSDSDGLSADEAERMQADLRATLQELAHLQNDLAKSNAALLMLERQISPASLEAAEDHEVIAAISQEIRQPMSSILGYTDLLLTESVGILGALQRKFLERIRASTERMRTMLDDLIQVAALGNGSLELLPKSVELATIIDDAMADTSGQLREKKITLRVDLPSDMPRIYADRDALHQIAVHLLQNAGTVTPNEGSVTMRARIQREDADTYLLLQVIDSGGGIQPELLARVFNRRYRADKPLIQGLGDTGVGLSIAKTLVEAHGGRIWVNTEPGKTTTFSVLLPIRPDPVETALK